VCIIFSLFIYSFCYFSESLPDTFFYTNLSFYTNYSLHCAHIYKVLFFKYCHVQGVARHWRKPVRTRVTPLDSSDTLYIVYLAYRVKFMYNTVRRFQHPCVRPVRFTHTTNISSTCGLDARTYCQFNMCVSSTCASNCAFYARIYY
jgi:hypothetical protein